MNCSRSIVVAFLFSTALLPQNVIHAQNTKENADFKLALNLYNDGLYDLAGEQLKQFINAFPGSSNGADARFHLGLAQMKLKQYDDARLTFQAFALTYQENPKAPDAWMNVGECFAAMKSYKEAALAFERVKVFHSKSKVAPDALVRSSTYFKLAGQIDDARRVLRVTLQEYSNSVAALQARTLLGQMYFEEGNLVQAQNELKRVVEGDPSPDAKAQALLILGNICQAMGQVSQAESNYQEIISKHKASLALQGAYLGMGRLLSSSGKFTEAIDNFKKALGGKSGADSSLTYDASVETGDGYVAMKDGANAIVYYERAIPYAPSAEVGQSVLWKIALAAAEGKNWVKSNDACNRILKAVAEPNLKRKATIRLALNTEERKDYAQAVQQYTTLLDQHPTDPIADEIAFRAARLTEMELHDARKAAASYEQFMARYSRSPLIDDAYAGAARCYEELKEPQRAVQIYREMLGRFPSTEFRQVAEERIRMIDAFDVREKDAGVEKLAMLLGDVLGEQDKIGLSYRLGEIYFSDLKNYPAAVVQFTNAINSGMKDERFVDALYRRARSLEYLTWKDKKFIPQAIEAYKTFLKAYPNEARNEDAALSLFTLNASTLQAARSSYDTTLAVIPGFRRRDMMLQRIGELQEQSGSAQGALVTYGAMVEEFRDSPTLPEVAYRRIPLLLTLGLADSALREGISYLRAFPNGPHSAEVTARVADLLVQGGASDRATEYCVALRDEFGYTSYGPPAAAKLAAAYMATGMYNEAIAVYSELIAKQTDNPLVESDIDASLLLAIGKAYQLAGNNKEATSYLFQALRKSSTDVAGAAYNALGFIAKGEGNSDLATSYFRQAGNVAPNAGTSRDVANLLFESGSYPDAIKQYARLVQAATNDTDRQYCEARIITARYRNDDLVNAEKDQTAFLKKYKNTEENVAAFDIEKGLLYYRKEDYVNARKSFDRVMDKYDDTPSAPFALYWTGKILESTKKQAEALKLYEQLMKNYPTSAVIPRVHLALGNIYYDLEKWDESIRNYKLIIDNPDADPTLLPVAMSNLIETYETAGVFDAALQLTRKYIESYPNGDDSFDKKIKIGILYQRLGYNDQSVLHLQTLLDEAGSDLEGEIRYYIAEANYNKGDYQQAILDFLKVPYLVTKKGKMDWTANSLYMAGQSYEKMGRLDQSLTMYQQILDRTGIDETFKAAAKKEIERVKLVLRKTDRNK